MDIDEISTRSDADAEAHRGKLADDAKQAAHDAKAAMAREMADAKARASDAARQIKDGARNAGDRVTALLSEQTERQKADIADSLRAVAQTMRDAAREQPEGMGARLVDEAAWRLEDVSGRLNDRSVAEMAEDVARFGRRSPGMFLAGCLVAGFAAGRFLTSGSEGRSNSYGDDDHDDAYGDARREPAEFGEDQPKPATGFSDYATDTATVSGAASTYRANAWAAGASGGLDATDDQDADLDDAYASEGSVSDTRVGTGFPADAGADERAPFGTGIASEGVEPEGSPTRGGGRDGGF